MGIGSGFYFSVILFFLLDINSKSAHAVAGIITLMCSLVEYPIRVLPATTVWYTYSSRTLWICGLVSNHPLPSVFALVLGCTRLVLNVLKGLWCVFISVQVLFKD